MIEDTKTDKTVRKRRFDKRDFDVIAEFMCDEHATRKRKREDLERAWKEVDRQVAMKPDISYKLDEKGQKDPRREWMSEGELPLQAQTLEVLTSDARRMLFPDSGPWFKAHVATTDEYLSRVDMQSLITGDENDVPTKITQDNADALLEGWLNHYHRQYDFAPHWDSMNAEAFKYGTLVGRGRLVSKEMFLDTARGIVKQTQKIPVLFPRSIKSVYLDDSTHKLMNEGHLVGPSLISEHWVLLNDLNLAAQKGSDDPEREDGGWMASALSKLEPDDSGRVHILEFEGDMVVPRKTVRSVHLPNVIVSVAIGKNAKRVFRFRFSKFPFTSYITHPYHQESLDTPYGVSPLMKGAPVQKSASLALNMLNSWAVLNVLPPVAWDSGMVTHQVEGGPVIEPMALWESPGGAAGVQPVEIGNGTALQSVYLAYIQQYFDVTGVNAPRLGSQTTSHTTAFAKDVEAQRGIVRTVDYVRSVAKGPLHRWLTMSFEMGKKAMKGEETFYIDKYGGFVTITKDHLPDMVTFDVFGAGGPDEEAVKMQRQLAAIQAAAGIDQMKMQLAQLGVDPGPPLNYEAIQREILGRVFSDIDLFFNQTSTGGAAVQQGVPGASQVVPGAPGTALASIAA